MNIPFIKETVEKSGDVDFIFFDSLPSTNDYAKEIAAKTTKPTVILAATQTGGKGSKGRSFFCEKGVGVYISLLFFPDLPPEKNLRITPAAAVAVCRTLERFSDDKFEVKWVNDIYKDGKKVCGILTEGAIENGKTKYAVVGVGINLLPPKTSFPDEIKDTAGTVFPCGNAPYERIVAALTDALIRLDLSGDCYEEYKKRLFTFPKAVYCDFQNERRDAVALDLDRDFRLLVRFPDGTETYLSSGDVSVRF